MAFDAADLALFFDADMPGYVLATVGGVDVAGLFRNAYQEVLGIVAGASPVLLLPTASVGSAAVGTSVSVGGTSYSIAEIQPDGMGLTRLVLKP